MFLDGLIYDQMTGEVFYYYYEENKIEKIKNIINQKYKKSLNMKCKFLNDVF